MDRDRGFRFKLLVPPRISHSHINAVRPQGTVGNHLPNSEQQHLTSELFISNSVNSLPAIVNIPQNNSSSGELYSKLFDEVEKIQSWKVKVENDTAEKERRLQDNKRTIETQRKAIQELQFSNESLSLKLEEQISENEDLRSKNNTTRNLCNILKETFQRSSEKMHLFESEREETHHLFMENSGSIKLKTIGYCPFFIVKEDLLQFEDLKEKYHQEYIMKDKENEMVQKKLEDKENELQKALLNLNEAQKCCKQLQDSTMKELEGQLSLEIEKNKECTFQMEQLKEDILQHEWVQLCSYIIISTFVPLLISSYYHQMLKDLESKSVLTAELENEVQKLKLTTAEAVKNKEDAELKCQHKIADMVALMEKHKSQYDRMVEEKDMELHKNKKKETEADARAKSLLDLSKQKIENDQLKKQLKTKDTEKFERLKDFTCKYPVFKEDTETPGGDKNRIGGISKMKSYRIRTPPSSENAGQWGKNTFELDSKSDSSDQIDLFVSIQSPVALKSPGSNLKLAAIKRMRDAGWTAVTNCDKKKKKTSDKIFA
uniref:Synaptonemal complex protein 1 n=1 Tax=Poecilia mexicana TaxID=48701 RepID=A0A3B3X508_9TELE